MDKTNLQPARAPDVAPRRGPMDDSGRRSHPISASINPAMQTIKYWAATAPFVTETRRSAKSLTTPLAPPAPRSARARWSAMIASGKTAVR